MRVEFIADPVHGHVPVTVASTASEVAEDSLLRSPWLRRLQRIHQMTSAYLVFPGATHTRFAHALGTCHLAGALAARAYERYAAVFGRRDLPERDHLVETYRLAGLLHDVGRCAFGDVLERAWTLPRYGKTHDDLAEAIIAGPLAEAIRSIRRSPDGPFEEPIDPAEVAAIIRPDREPESFRDRVFRRILHGPFSVDRLDYTARDSLGAGLDDGGGEAGLLAAATTVTDAGLALHASAVGALRDFLHRRLRMYEEVYYRGSVRAFDIAFSEILVEALDLIAIGDPFEDPDRAFDLDDWRIHSWISSWRRSPDAERRRIGAAWSDLLAGRPPWREAYRLAVPYRDLYSFAVRPTTADAFERALRAALAPEIEVRVDVPYGERRSVNPLSEDERRAAVPVFDPETGTVEPLGVAALLREIPLRFCALRVFARPGQRDEVAAIARDIAASLDLRAAGTSAA